MGCSLFAYHLPSVKKSSSSVLCTKSFFTVCNKTFSYIIMKEIATSCIKFTTQLVRFLNKLVKECCTHEEEEKKKKKTFIN
jgi:hypothetical protein